MFASGYTLDIYCDNPHGYGHGYATFFAEEGSRARVAARRAGWRFTTNGASKPVLCPVCSGKNPHYWDGHPTIPPGAID